MEADLPDAEPFLASNPVVGLRNLLATGFDFWLKSESWQAAQTNTRYRAYEQSTPTDSGFTQLPSFGTRFKMTEQEFASKLEFRICREFSGMSEGRYRGFWCDGVILEAFLLDDPTPRVLGHAWICKGSNQEEWKLELLLPKLMSSREEMNWEILLPAENVTRWLAVDGKSKLIQIEPAAAVADLE